MNNYPDYIYQTFDDVLIVPLFSEIKSRNAVDISAVVAGHILNLPVLSANMTSITGENMAIAMAQGGGRGVLHRFMTSSELHTIASRVTAQSNHHPWISVGIDDSSITRAIFHYELFKAVIIIDVAHGAQRQVVDFYKRLKAVIPEADLVIGNFATGDSIEAFVGAAGYSLANFPDTFKVGIGPGSVCETRVKTGVGVPQLAAIRSCVGTGLPIIADGGMRTPGDVCKALAMGAKAVMLGGMLAGTDECPGEVILGVDHEKGVSRFYKKYYGSASYEAYQEQNKDSPYITTEGESCSVPLKGTVANVLKDIAGGLRSSLAYVGAKNLREFQEKAQLIRVSSSTVLENGAHKKYL